MNGPCEVVHLAGFRSRHPAAVGLVSRREDPRPITSPRERSRLKLDSSPSPMCHCEQERLSDGVVI